MAYELLRLVIPHRIEGGEFPERIEIEEDAIGRQDLEREVRYYVPERTCTVESSHGYTDALVSTRYVHELSCHTLDDWPDREPPSYCPICGRRIEEER